MTRHAVDIPTFIGLKREENLEATNNEGSSRSTPLQLAANKGQLSAAQLLVENGAFVGAQT